MKTPGEKIVLIGRDFRLFHVVLILGSGFLLYSALGLDDDRRLVNGAFNMFYLHRYFGLIWGGLIATYAAYVLLSRKRLRILHPLNKSIIEQTKEGLSVIGRYFFNRKISRGVRQGMGRHNILASYAFVMMVFGLVFLAAGGIGIILSPSESGFYEIFLGIHVLGAGLLALFVLAHLFAVLNKANRPLVLAVFSHGQVRRSWAEHSMPQYMSDEYGSELR